MRADEIAVDLFAGGGGASLGIEWALGRPVAVAINHDPAAVAMHAANHPDTAHYCKSVYAVNPMEAVGGRPVGLLHASPDCRHHSKAKGGVPVQREIRDLAWVVCDWALWVRPRVITLENVGEFSSWGPLIPRCDGDGNPMIDARTGEPILVPCPERKGETFRQFVGQLRGLGYAVEWRVLNAADFGAPTSRRRLFLVARCDGQPIRWPEATYGPGRLHPYRTAAECIDWSLPCPSIFDRERPLAEKTLQRIARGIVRYVIENPRPFIVSAGPETLAPTLVQTGYGERPGQAPRTLDIEAPLGTVVAGGQKHALVAAFLAKHNRGATGQALTEPVHTLVGTNNKSLVLAHLHPAAVAHHRAGLVAAFLSTYYGQAVGQPLDAPLCTVVSRDRFALVTVKIDGGTYALADISMRMLQPRELARAQGFPDEYKLIGTKTQKVARLGNAVVPQVAAAVVRAQLAPDLAAVA